MIRTIFFDFGNVLGFFDHQRAVAKLARFTDLSPTELTLAIYGGVLEDDYEKGAVTTTEFVHGAILNGRLTCDADGFLACFRDIFWRNPEVCDLIPRLKPRHRLGLASNTNDAHFTEFSGAFADVLRHFDFLVTSHRAGERKPHRGFWEFAQAHADAEPGECLFVDDLPVNVEAAERFGWRGLVYRPDGTLAEKLKGLGVLFD